jgi:hypothetical protein
MRSRQLVTCWALSCLVLVLLVPIYGVNALPATSVSISFSPSSVVVGNPMNKNNFALWDHVYVTVSLTSGGVPLGFAQVTLYYKMGSTGNWQMYGQQYTSNGVGTFDVVPQTRGMPAGSTVYFKAVSNDPLGQYANGEAENTTGLAVNQYAPPPSFTSLNFSPNSVMVGLDSNNFAIWNHVQVVTHVSDGTIPIGFMQVTLYYKVGSSGNWQMFGQQYTINGAATFDVVPQGRGIPGGNTIYFKAASMDPLQLYANSETENTTGLIVQQYGATALTLDINPDTVEVDLAANTPKQYTQLDVHLESNGLNLGNKDISLYYKVGPSGNWVFWNYEVTNVNGNATFYVYPQQQAISGGSLVFFKANYTGSRIYNACEAESLPLNVVSHIFVTPEYPLGAVGALVTCLAGMISYKLTKKR